MRIGLVSPYDYATPGGVNQHVQHLARQLRALGHDVKELAPASQRRLDGEHYERIGGVVPIPVNASVARINLNLSNTRRVMEILGREAFDVIHLHEPFMPALPLTVLRVSRTANVGTFHAYARRNLGYYYAKGVLAHYLKRLHATVAVSPPARDFVRHYFPTADPAVIPNGVDVERFRPGHAPIRHLRDDCVNFLFVRRLEKRKEPARPGARVRARPPARARTRLIVVGEGPMKHWVEQYVQQHRVPNVVLAGRVPGEVLPRYHATADVFCAPATGWESFGIVLLEGMAPDSRAVLRDSGLSFRRDLRAGRADGGSAQPRRDRDRHGDPGPRPQAPGAPRRGRRDQGTRAVRMAGGDRAPARGVSGGAGAGERRAGAGQGGLACSRRAYRRGLDATPSASGGCSATCR